MSQETDEFKVVTRKRGNNRRDVLEKLAKGELDVDQAQNMLTTTGTGNVSTRETNFRITDRGAVALFSLQRRPIVLYPNQWRKLNGKMSNLMQFLKDNQEELQEKHKTYMATQNEGTEKTSETNAVKAVDEVKAAEAVEDTSSTPASTNAE